MECFTADFLRVFNENVNLGYWWSARYSPSNPRIPRVFLKFPNFLRSSVLSRPATREVTLQSLSGDNNLVPFHLR